MMSAIRNDKTPNFYFMHYDLVTWSIRNLLLIPHFAFPPSAIIKRNPTTPKGRKNPWIGCNIALNLIPPDARIQIVTTIPSPSLPSRGEEAQLKSSLCLGALGEPKPREGCSVAKNSRKFVQFVSTPEAVRAQFRKIKPLQEIPITQRGWMLDVLNIIRSLNKTEFTNQDIYAYETHLKKLHPDNHFIRDKIRQQLQNLARAGLLIHIGRNDYRLK